MDKKRKLVSFQNKLKINQLPKKKLTEQDEKQPTEMHDNQEQDTSWGSGKRDKKKPARLNDCDQWTQCG